MRVNRAFAMATTLVLLAGFGRVLAESFGALGESMHSMMQAEGCLKGTLPKFLCRGTAADQLTLFRHGIQVGDKAVAFMVSSSPDKVNDVHRTFQALAAGVDQLEVALKAGDAAKVAEAFKLIDEIRDGAHARYDSRPRH